MSRIIKVYKLIKEKSNKNICLSVLELIYYRIIYKCSIRYYINNSLFNDPIARQTHISELLKNRKWEKEYFAEKKFCMKNSSLISDTSKKRRMRRSLAYKKRYHAGEGLYVGTNNYFGKEHFLDGSLIIGSYVNFGNDIRIDYSGGVIIGNETVISEGCKVFSHEHPYWSIEGKDIYEAIPTTTKIGNNVHIFAGCVIYPGITIGDNVIVLPGSIVVNDIENDKIVGGNPAKVVKIL